MQKAAGRLTQARGPGEPFEDHCWKDVIPPDVIELYSNYRREVGVGPSPALVAIDLYELVYQGGAKPVAEVMKAYPNSCGEYAWAAIEPTKRLFAAARAAGLPVFYSTRDTRPQSRPKDVRATRRQGEPVDPALYAIRPEFRPQPQDVVITKLRASARDRRLFPRLSRDARRGMLLRPQPPLAQGEPLRHASQVRRRAAPGRSHPPPGRNAGSSVKEQGMGRLAGRVAIVTGGGHGIGKAYALGLAREGAKVVIAEIDASAAEAAAADLKRQGFEAIAVRTDVADTLSVEAMAARAVEAFGRIDVLVNNAAIFATIPMSRSPFDEIEIEEWDRMMAVNLRGTWLASRAVVPHMRKRGYGKIINISSGTALKGSASRIHYVTSKAGVLGFTRTLARELGQHGICVNCVAPGSTLSEENPSEGLVRMRAAAAEERAIQRTQKPEDLVGAIVFFASSESDFITGQTLVVDGGACMH